MAGRGSSWIGLCTFACNLDVKFCAPPYCSPTSSPLIEPTVSPFLPFAVCDPPLRSLYSKFEQVADMGLRNQCRGGTSKTGTGGDVEICKKACEFGHCPIHICKCDSTGALILSTITSPDATCIPNDANKDNRDYKNICDFLGERGRCVYVQFIPKTFIRVY